jgi:xanthine dehydrogenase accessory factor
VTARRRIVVVRGLGDIGSAVAHRLFGVGHPVVLHDEPMPTTTRRAMAFADAAFDGRATLEGIAAERVADAEGVRRLLATRSAIPVYIHPLRRLLEAIAPEILVDARVQKHARAEVQRGLASLTIGLGPGFETGHVCDLAVETSWEALGAVILEGAPLPLGGEPRALAGIARERYVYAPVEGTFRTRAQIGDAVSRGQEIAAICETQLRAPIAGILRGLTHDGVPVAVRTKVIEVDPRGSAAEVAGIGERPRRIAEGVLAALMSERGLRLLDHAETRSHKAQGRT